MFGRRVFCSGAIPRAMYSSLHISSRGQAQRLLPSMVPIVSSMGLVVMPSMSSLTVDGSGRSMVSASSDMADLEPLASSELIRTLLAAMCSARLIELWGVHDGCVFPMLALGQRRGSSSVDN